MKRLHCTQCGANLTKNEDGDYSCEYCGSIYKSKREKGKVFVKDSYYKFSKDDTVRDTEMASQTSTAEFTYKKVKPPIFIFLSVILVAFLIISIVIIPPKIQQSIEDNTPQTITYIAEGNGSLYINGTTCKEYTCKVIKGQEITIRVIPDLYHKFFKWSDDSESTYRTDTKTGKHDVVIRAFFRELDRYTLTYRCDEGGYLVGETTQEVYEGYSGTEVTVVDNVGYVFTGWSDGKSIRTRTDLYVGENITVTAKFYKKFASGTGTAEDPYMISNAEHFINIDNEKDGTYFKLKNSISFRNLSNFDWKGFDFSGYLDGDGYSITDLGHALFTNISASEIKNLVIDDASIHNTLYRNNYAGILANAVKGDVKITNCTVKNSNVTLSSSGTNVVGILIGIVESDSTVVIDNCVVESSIAMPSIGVGSSVNTKTVFVTGGIVGKVKSDASLEIINTTSKGVMSVSSVSFDDSNYNTIYAGGLIGCASYGSVIKISGNDISSKLDLVTVRNNVYVAGLIGDSQTKNENVTLGENDIAMVIPESVENTRTNVYYNELMH